MGWSKYSIKLFVYLIILSLIGFVFFWSLSSSQLIITRVVIAFMFVLFFIFLLRYVNKTNRDLIKFLDAIKYLDNVSSNRNSDLSFDQLNITYNEITNQLKDAWLEKEHEHQYFQYTIENIGVGIISFNKEGEIELFNKAAQQLLGVVSLKNINDLNLIGQDLLQMEVGKARILKLNTHIDQQIILAKSTEVKIGKKFLKLISLQDIKTQLEESELDAWQKLIRVLTHEIMNSVTPIKSLTYSMQKLLNSNDDEKNKILNTIKGLAAIEKRSKGLLDFVESYKNLTRIPKPVYERVFIEKMILNVQDLLHQDLETENIKIQVNINPNDLSIIADEKLITQVIINLFQNAIKAFGTINKVDKKIEIDAGFTENSKVFIKVTDNGPGIEPEVIDKIFVPFFSTHEGGSGVGLSFVRQIMVLHNGRVDVNSIPNKTTSFTLYF